MTMQKTRRNNRVYFDYVACLRDHGVAVPVIPGLHLYTLDKADMCLEVMDVLL